MPLDRPPPEPVPPRALHVPPSRGEAFDALLRELDVSETAAAVLCRPDCQIGPGRLAEMLASGEGRPEHTLWRIAERLGGAG